MNQLMDLCAVQIVFTPTWKLLMDSMERSWLRHHFAHLVGFARFTLWRPALLLNNHPHQSINIVIY
jgi:hypothetical protein